MDTDDERELVQNFVIEFLETGPEYIDMVEYADDNFDGDLDDEILQKLFQAVLDELSSITDRYGDTDGYTR